MDNPPRLRNRRRPKYERPTTQPPDMAAAPKRTVLEVRGGLYAERPKLMSITDSRRRYRMKHGIPIDAPLYSLSNGHSTERTRVDLAKVNWLASDSALADAHHVSAGFFMRHRRKLIKPRSPDHGKHRFGKKPAETIYRARRMKAAGLTLQQVGQKFGVSKQRVHQWLSTTYRHRLNLKGELV